MQIEKRRASGRPGKEDSLNREFLILETAVKLYAENGFENVKFKDVAEEAGVAISLIRHYFGTKEEFRESCTNFVISQLRQVFGRIQGGDTQPTSPAMFDEIGTLLIKQLRERVYLLRYLTRLFLVGDDKANALFREYYQMIKRLTDQLEAAGLLHEQANSVWVTFSFIFNQLGSIFLMDQIEDIIGADPYQEDVSEARTKTIVHMVKQGIFKE